MIPATEFARQGRRIDFVEDPPLIEKALAPGFYTIDFDMRAERLFLTEVEPFKLPPKLYGNIEERAERIKKTASARPGTTGVMLFGEKGSGKTLLGRKVALDLVEQGQPCIIMNQPFTGDMLGMFLQRIGGPFTLFLDEFEKVFDQKSQEQLLTVLDGTFPFRMLAIMTLNSSERVIGPLQNRPGRAFYSIGYHGLTPQFVREYAQDHLTDAEQVNDLVKLATLTTLNFDQLSAIIEEMNRFDEGVRDAIQLLNVDVHTGGEHYPAEAVFFHDTKVSCPAKDIVEHSVWIDLMDDDEENTVTLNVILPNEQNLTNNEASKIAAIAHGFARRHWDSRLDRDKFVSEGSGVHTHLPHRFEVYGAGVPTVNENGHIEVFFGRGTMGPVTLTLRKPYTYAPKKF